MRTDAQTYHYFAQLAHMPLAELERECEVETFHAHGPGGQGVNTADSAVRMRHVPTDVVVVSRSLRSQHQNRQACLRKLRARFAARATPPKPRVATEPTRGSVERRLADKRRRGETKAQRRRPAVDGD